MILVTGDIIVLPDHYEEILALSLEHVQRSRTEPGCISHNVSIDAENKHRLVFAELWQDKAALMKHFAVPASQDFVASLKGRIAAPPTLKVFEAAEIQMPA